MIRAIVFDFDGLLIGTEAAVLAAWRAQFREHGVEMPLDVWAKNVGTSNATYDPLTYLEDRLGRPLDRPALHRTRQARLDEAVAELPLLPGVRDCLDQAAQLDLKLAVASSSDRDWVEGHLRRTGIWSRFAAVCTAEDVRRVKPAPDLYQCAMARLDVQPHEAVAFEDSPNGARAAVAAGLYCTVVPSEATSGLPFDEVDQRLDTLAGIELSALLKRAYHHRPK